MEKIKRLVASHLYSAGSPFWISSLKALWESWYALCLFVIHCACSRYAVPVRDTLCLFVIRCACSWYAVPVHDTLWLFPIRCVCLWYAVPVADTLCLFPLRLTGFSSCLLLLTLIPLYNPVSRDPGIAIPGSRLTGLARLSCIFFAFNRRAEISASRASPAHSGYTALIFDTPDSTDS